MQSEQSIGEAASNAVGAVVEKAQEVGQAAMEKTEAVVAEVKTAMFAWRGSAGNRTAETRVRNASHVSPSKVRVPASQAAMILMSHGIQRRWTGAPWSSSAA